MDSASALAISLMRGPLVGIFLSLVLYGISCVQAFFYFQTYGDDSWRLKMTVALLFILETAHAATAMWTMDYYLVAQFGTVSTLQMGSWAFASALLIGFFIDICVYLYFTWRIWMFTRNKWIFISMCALCASRTGMSVYLAILSALKQTWIIYLHDDRMKIIWCTVIFFAGDTFSASVMAYHLSKCRSWLRDPLPDRPRRIETVLNRLLVFAIATGALTSFTDVIIIILLLVRPHDLTFFSAVFILIHLYSNSVLASLNIRNAILPNDASMLGIELSTHLSLQFADLSDLQRRVSKLSEPETRQGEAGVVNPVSRHYRKVDKFGGIPV